ncbi:hypothetical protein [Roseospira visakhapatnamensis]|uniref:Uncharacterized protein n=1 Tax=Roseospira visakhapatnamensis TaxID=390880 RepID=A0A7W6W8S8_9PROT|nr:hypothetical protein [Roseospira visakhapatnamensis]MBB4264692.1 hypothetical protein [Roseospira visakhapatnamensis]
MTRTRHTDRVTIRAPRRTVGRALGLAVSLALAAGAVTGGVGGSLMATKAQAQGYQPPPGPRVMLCLFDERGRFLAGSPNCPGRVRPRDAVMPQAHCFYDRRGHLWRGLPRCPSVAPSFLMDEASRALDVQG